MWALAAIYLCFGMCDVVKADNILDIQLTGCKSDNGYVSCEVYIENTSDKNIEYCELTILLMNDKKMVGSNSRPITDLPSGSFISKRFWWNNVYDFNAYKWSAVKIRQ